MTRNAGNAYGIGDGDIKYFLPIEEGCEFFPIAISEQEMEVYEQVSQSAHQKSEQDQKQPQELESALCHHAFQEGISADGIRMVFANHSVNRCRASLAAVNQIIYHLCRQSVSGRVSAATLSGFVRGGVIRLKDSVAYSCHWAAAQMEKWWGDAMSPSTFRRIRDDLAGLECFEIDRVAPQSTYKITSLHKVDIRQLLRVAAVLIDRLSAEADGFVLLMPSHRVGLLAALWGNYFSGTIYAPDSECRERSVESAETDLAKAEELAQEFGWSEYLSTIYRAQASVLKRTVRHLRDRSRASIVDHRLFDEPLPF